MLEILRSIVESVANAKSSSEAFRVVIDGVNKAIGAEVCSLYCIDYERRKYRLMANRGLNAKLVGRIEIPFFKGLVGLVAEREELINLQQASSHPRFLRIPELNEEAFETFLGVPILHQRRLQGILVVQRPHSHDFGSDEESFLVTLSAQLGGLLARININDFFSKGPFTHSSPQITGIPGAMGVAVAPVYLLLPPAELEKVPDRKTDDIEAEITYFQKALEQTQKQVIKLGEQIGDRLPTDTAALFDAYQKMLAKESLGHEVESVIRNGWRASTAIRRVINSHVQVLEQVADPYLKERAADLRDLGRRILSNIKNPDSSPEKDIKEPVIVIADEISPSMLAEVPKDKLRGIVSVRGSLTSHVTILAKALNVPAVLGIPNISLSALEGKTIVLDGYKGFIDIAPNKSVIKAYQQIIQDEKKVAADLAKLQAKKGITADGQDVPLYINTGLYADLVKSRQSGVSGIGLYRSEIPFMHMERFPSEDEQTQIYREVLAIFHGYPVAMRTLDVGADKELPYFSYEESNPYLGWRGIRVTLDHPEIFLAQVRAMLKASINLNNLQITLPMISHVEEIDESLKLIRKAYKEIQEEYSDTILAFPKIGAMIEVPSAVVMAESIAKKVDYFSIGSNDLTQYLLAVDRHNSHVANLFDALHPAVIHSIKQVIQAAKKHQIPASLCGEIAGDPLGALAYTGLGVDALSMNTNSMPRVKKLLACFTMAELRHAANEVLKLESSTAIRQYLSQRLDDKNLGGLIRAGR